MSRAKEEILRRIRTALADSPRPAPAPREYRTTVEATPDELVALLSDRLEDYRASVRVCSASDLTAKLAGFLVDVPALVAPSGLPDDWLDGYQGDVLRDEPLSLADLDAPGVAVLTGCAVAIAETGTIVLDTGPGQGRRALTLVPDHHVCVVHSGQIRAGVPEALAALPNPTWPVTFISGPSATSDIELNRVEGVHGPRRLDVLIVMCD